VKTPCYTHRIEAEQIPKCLNESVFSEVSTRGRTEPEGPETSGAALASGTVC